MLGKCGLEILGVEEIHLSLIDYIYCSINGDQFYIYIFVLDV